MVVLPIEVKSRELNSKLLIASHLLEMGSSVLLGHDIELNNSDSITKSVYLLKSAATFESDLVLKLRRNGNLVTSLDEEGIIPPVHDPSLNTRFCNLLVDNLDALFVNGDLELALIESSYKGDKLLKTGNPRFDLLQSQYRGLYAKDIAWIDEQAKDREIILIASRFGDVNCHKDLDFFQLLRDGSYIFDDISANYFESHYTHTKKIFEQFLNLPQHLAKEFPDKLIVVRPHPSEDLDLWEKSCNASNILITTRGDISAWLHYGVKLVQNGCTTAVEASFSGNHVVSYKPCTDPKYDNTEADLLGMVCKTIDEVVAELKVQSYHPKEPCNIIYNKGHEDSSRLLAQHLRRLDYSVCSIDKLRFAKIFKLKRLIRNAKTMMTGRSYSRSKFPGLDIQELYEKLKTIYLARHSGQEFKVLQVATSSFVILPLSNSAHVA